MKQFTVTSGTVFQCQNDNFQKDAVNAVKRSSERETRFGRSQNV